jgi:predicted dehydrogenase
MDRRNFLKSSGLAATSFATASLLANASETAQTSPNNRVRVGHIGVGSRGGGLLGEFASQKDVEIVSIADVDPEKVARGVEIVHEYHGKTPQTTNDYRRMLDDPSIDIISVATPDHWHAIPTILACQAGKDVYVEKPDAYNMLEGQRMVQAMHKHGRIVQMGTQQRSSPHQLEAREYILSGKLGKVLVAKAWENAIQSPLGRPADSDPPAGVDYDMWLGPAPKRAFNPLRFHVNWRWFFDYGTGDLGNDGVHRLDYARWALGAAVEAQGGSLPALPQKIFCLGGKWYFNDAQEWPDTLQVNFEYASESGAGHILTYEMRLWAPYNYQGEGDGAMLFGDKGYIILGNNRWRAFGERNKLVAEGKADTSRVHHVRNFIESVRSRNKPSADLETVGHPSSMLCHVGNIAWRLGRQLRLDAATETFVGDDEANAMRTRPEYRKPWLLPEV